ncbi:tetratricopeptide repeat protein [Klebsiella pneumoniae]|uniref:tetratricopeptide repeat protein n=1 Tax=Klebsiella pneumoniae TaxID=573 RepID=UPI00374FCF15
MFDQGIQGNNACSYGGLALLYYDGQGVQKNIKRSFELDLRGAELGSYAAQFNVARAYDFGIGVKKDLKQAFYWYKIAAENGSPAAMDRMADVYLLGRLGQEKDIAKGKMWQERAKKTRYELREEAPSAANEFVRRLLQE